MTRHIFVLMVLLILACVKGVLAMDSIPQGYHLYAYDDCGVEGRQPHVKMDDCYIWTFNTSDTDADLKSRSAVFSYKKINAVYENLDPKLDYVLAVTYASDHVYKRVQSMWADDVQLHEPYALPNAQAVRLICKVPAEVTHDGKMTLEWRIHGEVNATVSIIELWASKPPPGSSIRFESVAGLYSELAGRVLGLTYDGVADVEVQLAHAGNLLATTKTQPDGRFSFDGKLVEGLDGDLQITASRRGEEISKTLSTKNLFFKPVHYRPIPDGNQISLDGDWKINPAPLEDARTLSLDDKGWGKFRVPGQWLQQGYDVPQDKPVALAREFTIPKEWAGRRIFLRFDAIHAGTDYRLNGRHLGYSENLYTPVEWEITDSAHIGMTNRLDLRMVVSTVSEKLSYSSAYAFHNLGGIDRSVRLYALPQVNIKDLNLSTDLDKDYRDADLHIKLAVDGPAQEGLSLHVSLRDPDGKPVKHSVPKADIKTSAVDISTHVENPLKWNAEKPCLYKLALELKQGDTVLERIERNIGFREIEIKDRQLYVNGVRVKLAGACHHEMDPLAGRADTMRHAEEDVRLMKAANLNYIRTSHYPPCKELLDAADRIGMYVEVEAPFCWVGPREDMDCIKEVLTPTSAMVDYCHAHPSVIVWSLANESNFNEFFEVSNKLCKDLDPTRPTTFNNPDPEQICDIANVHYPQMPWHEQYKDNPRPIFLGEYWFPVCHEQTDVSINPGLREFFGRGHTDPDSDRAKEVSKEFDLPVMKPCAKPGAWSGIYNSDHMIGGAIWASHDDAFYFADGKYCGYAWHHGFWGLIDVWRRPKPEWWLSKLIFSPVWFPVRQVDFKAGQQSIFVPVENRYSFTDLSELKFAWEIGKKKGDIKAGLPPASTGEIEIPIPPGTLEGDKIILRVTNAAGDLINTLAIHLGREKQAPLPTPQAGAPKWSDDGKTVQIEGKGFSFVLNRSTGDFDSANPKQKSPVIEFPSLHVTRYDFGDLAGPDSPPYAEFPDAKTRFVDKVDVEETAQGLRITIQDHYDGFAGSVSWLMDKNGMGRVSYDYAYSGEEMNCREVGMKFLLNPNCDEVKWRRWSEWDVYPDDFIGRTEGSAKARRDKKWGEEAWDKKPTWPWSLDQTELGTADFRSVKFNVYEASLAAPDGNGIRVYANADVHVRPALSEQGVSMHVLSKCQLGQIVLKKGDHLSGEYVVELLR